MIGAAEETMAKTSETRTPARPPVVASKAGRRRATAKSMASQQREISVSEFFTKNRHLLGFDSPTKALLTTIKEAVDNSLDACEEAEIQPSLDVAIEAVRENRYRIAVTDNGPGILKNQIPRIFGKLLYGSKFHRLRQSRGQQGIGISAAGMYGQLTTGKPVVIESRTSKRRPAHHYELVIDTKKNEPVVKEDSTVAVGGGARHAGRDRARGRLPGRPPRRRDLSAADGPRQSARRDPVLGDRARASTEDEPVVFDRASSELPVEAQEIKPHPYGVEVGLLLRMLKDTKATTLKQFFQTEFSRVGPTLAKRIAEGGGLTSRTSPRRVSPERAEQLLAAIRETRIPAPPTNCLSPIGEERILASLGEQVEAEFYAAVTRPPSVYRGNPFQVEVGLAYGGDLPADDLAPVLPLRQPGAAARTRRAPARSRRRAGDQLEELRACQGARRAADRAAGPAGAHRDRLGAVHQRVQGGGRLLRRDHQGDQAGAAGGRPRARAPTSSGPRKHADAERKRQYIEKYIPHIGIALREILDLSENQEKRVVSTLTDTLERSRKM